MSHDVIVIGCGLAGMTAAHEAALRGKKVLMLDMEAPQSLGGQAFWSLGGLFMVDTPEQRRMGIKDSAELALSDWMGAAQFDRAEDENPRRVAEAFVDWAAGGMREELKGIGYSWFPVVGWAERGGALAHGHGNSVPRFHITWGVGEGIVKPYARLMQEHQAAGTLEMRFRHRVTGLEILDGAVKAVSGEVLADDSAVRGASTNREVVGDFRFEGAKVIIASGGIGGNHELVRQRWPEARLGKAPAEMISGVPDFVDGQMIEVAKAAGAEAINEDRMWHYVEGIRNWDPIWPKHAIRILPGPSSMWFDANGARMEAPCLPGFDTMSTMKRILSTGHGHSWFILTQSIIEKEFALSGSEQNPDFASGRWREVLKERLSKGATGAVEAFKENGEDFVVASDLESLVARMNKLSDVPLDAAKIRAQIEARDLQIENPFSKDAQVTAIRGARAYRGDRLVRTAKPHRILDPKHGPLIGVKLNVLTRKSLGGLHTDVNAQVIGADNALIDGLYAVGEASGFGGGGYHGYNALEGTFLGGCLFSGRAAGRHV